MCFTISDQTLRAFSQAMQRWIGLWMRPRVAVPVATVKTPISAISRSKRTKPMSLKIFI